MVARCGCHLTDDPDGSRMDSEAMAFAPDRDTRTAAAELHRSSSRGALPTERREALPWRMRSAPPTSVWRLALRPVLLDRTPAVRPSTARLHRGSRRPQWNSRLVT
jgi:hypothetical protein